MAYPTLFWLRLLVKNQPLYALQSRGLDGKQQPLNTIEAMADTYIKAIREILPFWSLFYWWLFFRRINCF